MNKKLLSPKLHSQVDKILVAGPSLTYSNYFVQTFKKPSPEGVMSLKVIFVDITSYYLQRTPILTIEKFYRRIHLINLEEFGGS